MGIDDAYTVHAFDAPAGSAWQGHHGLGDDLALAEWQLAGLLRVRDASLDPDRALIVGPGFRFWRSFPCLRSRLHLGLSLLGN